MQTDYAGIDYGLGRTNVDHATGIRYGVIQASKVGQAWYDSSEPYYEKPRCPECQAEAVEYDYDLHGDWPYNRHECCDYACEECEQVFGSESAFPEEPLAFGLDDGEYLAEQSGHDTDIFILKSPYYTWCQYCSPCAPGAGYLENWMAEGQGVKAFCFGHNWFESRFTGQWIDCEYCNGLGLRSKESVPNYNEERFVVNGGKVFDDGRVVCWICGDNAKYGMHGKVKEYKNTAPYPVYSIASGGLVEA